MKPSIDKSTLSFIDSLTGKVEEEIVNYYSPKEGLDSLIMKEGLKIHRVYVEKGIDLLVIILSNRKIIARRLSEFNILWNAGESQLQHMINQGIGIHWPELDYDLSLHGFLEHEIVSSKTT